MHHIVSYQNIIHPTKWSRKWSSCKPSTGEKNALLLRAIDDNLDELQYWEKGRQAHLYPALHLACGGDHGGCGTAPCKAPSKAHPAVNHWSYHVKVTNFSIPHLPITHLCAYRWKGGMGKRMAANFFWSSDGSCSCHFRKEDIHLYSSPLYVV
jgi:hypothetical protein